MGQGAQEKAGGHSEDKARCPVLSHRNGGSFGLSLYYAKAPNLLQKLSTSWFEQSISSVDTQSTNLNQGYN